MTPEFDRAIGRLAARQHGVFSRWQAVRLGGTRGLIQHRLATGRWDRMSAHVFRLAGSTPSWRQSLTAACLAWGPGAIVSHLAAAALWRFPGFAPRPVELTMSSRRRVEAAGVVHHRRLRPTDTTTIEGFRVTSPARTLLDIAGVASRELVEEALDDALRRGLVSIARLRRDVTCESWKRQRGIDVIRELLDARDGGPVPQSVFETRLLRLLRRTRLPEPVCQHEVRAGGRLIAIVDFAWPDLRVVVEADGYRWHSGRIRWERDRERRNALTLLGWRIVHVTWSDLIHRPQHVVGSIGAALADAAKDEAHRR